MLSKGGLVDVIDTIPKAKSEVVLHKDREKTNIRQSLANGLYHLLIQRGWLFAGVGLLLGRAVILSVVSPFAVSYLATIWTGQRKHTLKVMVAVVLGAISHSTMHGIYSAAGILLFVLLINLFGKIRRTQLIIPFLVFGCTMLSRVFIYTLQKQLTSYEWMLILVEGILGMVLVLIFMQSIPLIAQEMYKPRLKNEEIICLMILLASILTGTIGWAIYGAQMEQILSRYFVLILSFVGGAAIGSTVGVVAGLILSLADVANLYEMSLLAFSGLLGGLLREGNKLGVSIGLLVGTSLLGLYGMEQTLTSSLLASGIAIALFFLTPKQLTKRLSAYIPGTEDYTDAQEQYVQKVRNVTAKRVEQFSGVFEALSKSFESNHEKETDDIDAMRETDYFLSQVTERTCQTCFMKERCWQKQFDKTYSLMGGLKDMLINDEEPNGRIFHEFETHCVKSNKVLDVMQEEASHFALNKRLKEQVLESKRLVADQLRGVSDVMDDFAKEIMKEREQHEKQEGQIMHALEQMGIRLEKLEIYQLEKGNIDIEMTIHTRVYHGEAHKLIAPVLSDILDETVVVKEEKAAEDRSGHMYLTFGSSKQYKIKTGIAGAAKNGGLISGDSYTTIEIGTGKYAIAISDGMGNGERASEESEETLRLLQQILQTGIAEKVAIKSLNSILSLRSTDEMFATLDLAVINLHNASANFLKIGSAPSFILRGEKMIDIESSNLPIGIIQEVEVEVVKQNLHAGDLIVMMSDGIYEGPKHVYRMDLWLQRKLKNMQTNDPQAIADLLLEEVIRENHGEIQDDMTVVVAQVERNTPEWAAISMQYDEEETSLVH